MASEGSYVGILYGSRRIIVEDPRGGMDPIHRHGVLSKPARVEVREHRGERVLMHWYAESEAVRATSRLDTVGERVARIRNYFYTPDFIVLVASDMGLPVHTNGYRYWGGGAPTWSHP